MNANLGLFDMTLALSTSKINSQFAFLQKKGIIKKDWKFLSDLDGYKTLNGTDPNFATALSAWKNSLDHTLEDEFKAIDAKITAEVEKDEPDLINIKAWQKRKVELVKLMDEKSKYSIFHCALDCEIDPPKVWLIKGESNKLYFEIPIKTGTLSYKKDGVIKVDKIDGSKYVFTVPVANKIVKKADVILGDTEQDKLVLNDISDDIFRIESLFLDFQNANIAQYDKTRSIILTDSTTLQITLTNYFSKIVARTDNPYILGYSIQRKVATRDALLQPTTATYSTSFSTEERSNAFNFLMQVDNHALPIDQRRGMLPKSLIEDALDKSPTVNGVMGINYQMFMTKYVDEVLTPQIAEAFGKSLRSIFVGFSYNRTDLTYKVAKDGFSANFYLNNRKITEGTTEKRGILISWDIEIKGSLHKEVEKKILGFIDVGTIGMDQRFSTSGAFKLNEHSSKKGKLSILVSASTQGQLMAESFYEKPFIAKDTEMPEYTNPGDVVKDILLGIIDALSMNILAPFLLMKEMDFAKNIDDKTMDNFRLDDLGELNTKVILPGSNVFTFKTLRLLTRKQDDQDAILFDIAYAPESLPNS
ncbi:hypothetical protein [Haliscomenobacter sp.]|uniref:hypothetical protein n=1 Tax=Haliscomenobacter sp. TaxID=2717303 RepID=UPI003BABDAC9